MGATTFSLLRKRQAAEAEAKSKTETPTVDSDGWELSSTGGGWYEIRHDGKAIDKVRGEDAADERLAELKTQD